MTALDRAIVEVASSHNHGELRVPDMEMAPVYFAPGANSNPLVASSNPLDIAQWIKIGLYDRPTLHRIQRFAKALLEVNRISSQQAMQIVSGSNPSRQPVLLYSDTGRVKTSYRGLDDREHFADEFITYPEECVRNYTYLIEDNISVSGKHVQHTQRFNR